MKQNEQWQRFLTAIHTYHVEEIFSANQLAQKIGITPFTARSMINIYQIIKNSDAPTITEQQINKRIKVYYVKILRERQKR